MHKKIIEELKMYADSSFAKWLRPFLSLKEDSKDILLGVRVPILRKLAKKYSQINEKNLLKLLTSKYHESRALALFIMVLKSKKESLKMCEIYLSNLDFINNWDLIDYTCPHIVAPVITQDKLLELSDSEYLWANRVAMVSTIYYIKKGDYFFALKFAKKYMNHKHHLMHKAAGWMLREIGKKDESVLKKFLEQNEKNMPVIMKSYAKEHLR